MQRPETLPRGWSVRIAALMAGSAVLVGLLLTSSAGYVFAQSVAPSAAPSVAASTAPVASAAPSVAASSSVSAPSASAAASGGVLGASGSGSASAPATSTLPADTGSSQTSLLLPLLLLAGVFVAATFVLVPRLTRRR